MKKIIAFVSLLFTAGFGFSQTTARLTNQKDAFGSTYTYVGEVKGNVPNGLGLAVYASDNTASYYVGYFLNGQYSGKGCIMFNNSTFLSGDWKAGKLNGKGTSLNKDGGLYIGDWVDGKKEGKGTYFYKDNSFLVGNYSADDFSGRCLFFPASGLTLTDNIYKNGKKNGSGFQYELKDKTLFEGEWSNGEWVKSAPATYTGFVKSSSFFAEKSDNQIILGGINKANKNLIHDTAFFYDLKNKKRYFGRYENGFLKSGLTIKDDTSRFLGNLTSTGAQGQGSFMRLNRFYDEGNYVDDYLTGPGCTSLDLANKTVYYGGMLKGASSGKAFFVTKNKDLFVGEYVKGKFTGTGWRIRPDGIFTKGTWEDGMVATVTTLQRGDGSVVNLKPKNLGEAISTLYEFSYTHFDPLTGVPISFSESDLSDNDEIIEDVNNGLLVLPGVTKNLSITSLLSEAYIGLSLKTSDPRKAIDKYLELCKAVQQAQVVLKKGAAPVKLEGRIKEVPAGLANVVSRFTVPGYDDTNDFNFNVILQQVSATDYRVYIGASNSTMLSAWITGE